MSDVLGPKNEYKVLRIFAGADEGASGENWIKVLGTAFNLEPIEDYISPGLVDLIGLEGNTTFTISTSNETTPALAKAMEKMKKTPIGKLGQGAMAAGRMVGGVAASTTDAEDTAADQGPTRAGFLESLGLPGNVRYQTDLSLLPAWQGTSPVKLESITFNFQMGMAGDWDARTEVYNPVIALAAANLPRREGARLYGPLPSQEFVLGTIIGGLLSGGDEGGGAFNIEQSIESVFQRAEARARFNLYNGGWTGIWGASLGRLKLPDFYVGSTSHSFSTDTDDNGYPISGKVVWSEIKSLRVAHRGLETFRIFGKDD